MNWNKSEESRFTNIQRELEQMAKRRAIARKRVQDVLSKCFDSDFDGCTADLAIKHADELRDALAPFDSGARCEPTT